VLSDGRDPEPLPGYSAGVVIAEPAPGVLSTETLPAGSAGHDPLDVTTTVKLAGREKETSFLEDCWRAVQKKGSCVALIGGEAGVGKTRLVEEFANHLRWQGIGCCGGAAMNLSASCPTSRSPTRCAHLCPCFHRMNWPLFLPGRCARSPAWCRNCENAFPRRKRTSRFIERSLRIPGPHSQPYPA